MLTIVEDWVSAFNRAVTACKQKGSPNCVEGYWRDIIASLTIIAALPELIFFRLLVIVYPLSC
ncbi:hypothetical protein LIPSTDRAFT_108342 [Lipomyces starkeyi NRRL Y-11557]|uniref:Uncharacterized protein n=1 Tax=Lipomyces starkeyi NRRL Y-11557 TaxID=675824 RepID=A0A1E3PV27_LIPST|nr:hypothetical protein LIPSTDRAFT_108342 [Lipomyces starkeyi NRRL Y-11557]